jgi:hypothetical protein
MSSDLIGGLDLNQPIKWADFRLDALLVDTMLPRLYTYCREQKKKKKGHQNHALTQWKMLLL